MDCVSLNSSLSSFLRSEHFSLRFLLSPGAAAAAASEKNKKKNPLILYDNIIEIQCGSAAPGISKCPSFIKSQLTLKLTSKDLNNRFFSLAVSLGSEQTFGNFFSILQFVIF